MKSLKVGRKFFLSIFSSREAKEGNSSNQTINTRTGEAGNLCHAGQY
jgi:hypothetical protein